MIEPVLRDDAFLADVASASGQGDVYHLWWIGQSGFMLKWRGRTVLFDPYLSESLTKKYAGTDKEHVRMTARCVAPEQLGFVDCVASSHAHTDHLDAETLLPLGHAHAGPLPLVLPMANAAIASERLAGADFEMHGLDAGTSVRLGEFEFTGIPAAHDTIERDAKGHCRFLGFIVRFGPWTIYHSGDTRWHDELPRLLSGHRPDVVLLPINGHDPDRGVAGNLNGAEAAALAKHCGAALAIPHHFEMFTFNTDSPDAFIAACAKIEQPCRVLRCGERWTSGPAVTKV
jgi:L-ascorbate metabolism protein UlaG (beta-lactamase superfamily)